MDSKPNEDELMKAYQAQERKRQYNAEYMKKYRKDEEDGGSVRKGCSHCVWGLEQDNPNEALYAHQGCGTS